MKVNTFYKITSILVLLVFLLAACQPAAPEATQVVVAEPTQAPEAEAPAEPEPTQPPAAAPGEIKDVPREKTYVVTLWSDTGGAIPGFDNWNPFMNSASLRNAGDAGMSEHQFYRNLNAGDETPWLAESYKPNADFTQWTMNLRKGVEWSDGEAFTCADVKFTIEMVMANAPDMNQSTYFKEWTKDVSCTDDYTVVINLNKPNSRYMYPLVVGWEYHFPIVPEHIWKDVEDPKTFTYYDPAKGWPVYTGPYKLVSASGTQIIMDRRDDWWGVKTGFHEAPAPERIIVIPFGSDTVMAEKYITNQIDYGGPLLIGTYLAAVEKNDKLIPWFKEGKVRGAPDGCLYDLILNNDLPLFKDKNVRLALNYATDRQQLVDLAYLGSTHPAIMPFSDYISNWWNEGELKTVIDSYDRGTPSAEKVEQYMTEAGYAKNGDGFWEKDGQTAKFTIVTPDWLAPIGPVLTEQYTQAGFDVTEAPDRTNAYSTNLTAGNYDANIFVFCGSLYDPWDTLSFYHTSYYAPIGSNTSNAMTISGGGRYQNPELDTYLDAMKNMIPDRNDPKYMENVIAATKIILEDMPAIVLAAELHVIPANYTYWTGFPNSEDPYTAPFPCWRDIFLMTMKLKPAQ
jgi:peptide/nickel transport system substrate-binding protein